MTEARTLTIQIVIICRTWGSARPRSPSLFWDLKRAMEARALAQIDLILKYFKGCLLQALHLLQWWCQGWIHKWWDLTEDSRPRRYQECFQWWAECRLFHLLRLQWDKGTHTHLCSNNLWREVGQAQRMLALQPCQLLTQSSIKNFSKTTWSFTRIWRLKWLITKNFFKSKASKKAKVN